jgi:two-component system response regulator AtoC
VLSPSNNIRQMVDAIRSGAQDYLTVPVEELELASLIERYTSQAGSGDSPPATEVEELTGDLFFVAASTLMRKLRAQAELLADIDVPVLMVGESGTGKEVAARLIHKLSSRAHRRFLKVNCAALPGDLLESELFGYERGAFTGAIRTKQGKFELCDKGTILLDEIAEMPSALQAKLLQVLQDKEFFRLGGEKTIVIDVRILAATNVDIDRAIAERKLREDLYYRLSTFTIQVPPLRERKEEIPVLLRHFMNQLAERYSLPAPGFSSSLLQACVQYPWPGNVRELENFVKRYLVMQDESAALKELRPKLGRSVREETLAAPSEPPPATLSIDSEAVDNDAPSLKSLVRSLKDETEISAITRALEKTNWNRKLAARNLNISYRGLLYKIQQYGLTPPKSQLTPAVSAYIKV